MFKNMKIGRKLILGFVIVTILASISGIISIFMMHDLTGRYGNALVNYGFTQGDIGKTMALFCRVDGNIHNAVSYTDPENEKAARDSVTNQTAQMEEYFTAVKNTSVTDEEAGSC